MTSEAQRYVDDLAANRSYVREYHKHMADHDFPVPEATSGLVEAAHLEDRVLNRRTKELVFAGGAGV